MSGKAESVTTDHLRYSQLADIAEGRITPDEAMRAHLAECASCAGELEWLDRVIGLMRDAAADPAPAWAAARLRTLFEQRRPSPGAPRPIEALLRFDSARSAPAFGLRSGGAHERQLLLRAEAYDVDLRIAPSGESWALSGQLLGHPGPGGGAELMGAAGLARAEMNDLLEFALAPVPAGRYTLTLALGDQTIVVSGLELGQ